MATTSVSVQNAQILLVVWVRKEIKEQSVHSYKALFDTGAQMTMITEKVATSLGLIPIGDVNITPASGVPIKTERYKIRLDIPIAQNVILPDGSMGSEHNFFGNDIFVGKLPYNPSNYDVIIGMDFIRLFHITMYGDLFLLSN